MAGTKIEWADAVWNPITGCTPISEGCAHCYAQRMANRLAGRYGYPADNPFRVTAHHDRMKDPINWEKPKRIFVCSMGDIFHEDACDDFPVTQLRIFNLMNGLRRHTFMVLTKRPQNLQRFVALFFQDGKGKPESLPPNIWIGVTAENQARADERIPILLQIPAAVRFVSIEPMLGPVDLNKRECLIDKRRFKYTIGRYLDWVICGGETGPGARTMHPEWVRGLRDQCQSAGVPFFFKQWGEWGPYISTPEHFPVKYWDDGIVSLKTGKKLSGRLLDGREWSEFPAKK